MNIILLVQQSYNNSSMKKILLIFTLLILCACNKKEKVNVDLIDDLNVEINSEVKIDSFIKNSDEISIVNGNDLVNTTELGEKEVVLKYYDKKNTEQYYSFKINIVDTIPPEIECNDTISTDLSKEVDLLKNVKVTDNSKEKINVIIDGEYDYNKIGNYKLKYVAKDSSGNESIKEFTLIVKGYNLKTTGYYVHKRSDVWVGLKFEKNGKVTWQPWWCPGLACGGGGVMYGTYKLDGNKIIAIFTETYDDASIKTNINKKFIYTLTSDNKIIDEEKDEYNWQKKYL